MKLLKKALILSTCCSLLASCQTVQQTEPLRPDLDNPARMVCEGKDEKRPAIPPTYVIDWSKVETVKGAREEHEAYVRSIVDRNKAITAYIIEIEGRLFVCSNNMQWWRDYWRKLGG